MRVRIGSRLVTGRFKRSQVWTIGLLSSFCVTRRREVLLTGESLQLERSKTGGAGRTASVFFGTRTHTIYEIEHCFQTDTRTIQDNSRTVQNYPLVTKTT